MSDRYLSLVLPLALLVPDIVEPIAAGHQPADLTAYRLIRIPDLPICVSCFRGGGPIQQLSCRSKPSLGEILSGLAVSLFNNISILYKKKVETQLPSHADDRVLV